MEGGRKKKRQRSSRQNMLRKYMYQFVFSLHLLNQRFQCEEEGRRVSILTVLNYELLQEMDQLASPKLSCDWTTYVRYFTASLIT